MAEFKYTIKLGANTGGVAAIAAGNAEAQTDTISINMDVTNMTRGDALNLIERAKDTIIAAPWPPL